MLCGCKDQDPCVSQIYKSTKFTGGATKIGTVYHMYTEKVISGTTQTISYLNARLTRASNSDKVKMRIEK